MVNQENPVCKCNYTKIDADIKKNNKAKARCNSKSDIKEKNKGKKEWVKLTQA